MRRTLILVLLALVVLARPLPLPCPAVLASMSQCEIHVLAGVPPDDCVGGTSDPAEHRAELTEEQRKEIQQRTRQNIELLRAAGRLDETETDRSVLLGWPLRLAAGLTDPGYHVAASFVDHDPVFPGALLDYDCNGRTYDMDSGYNHRGTDLVSWPFWWLKMDNDEVEVVAAAAGQIAYREDGHYDRNCDADDVPWNVVSVRHADGSVAMYGHLKNGSLTSSQVGDSVARGAYLGIVGSSGRSSLPHLHLEVHDSGENLIDPFAGPCNGLNVESWWENQRPYYDSAVNKLTTGDAAPIVLPECPTPEEPNARVTFGLNPTIYFTGYYRDQLSSQATLFTIYRPDDSIYSQFSFNSPTAYEPGAFWTWTYYVGPDEQEGTWLFELVFNGQTYHRPFAIGSPAPAGRVPQYRVQGAQLTIVKIGENRLNLNWGASCVSGDTDYAVYEGSIGDFASHLPVMCSTGGAPKAVVTPDPGNRYYLVVPRNTDREGSAGKDSGGAERPDGLSTCVAREVIDCP